MSQQTFAASTNLTKGRSRVYQFLSQFFLKEVTPETLAILLHKETKEALYSLDIDINRIIPDTPQDKLLDDLAQEYAALFIVSGGIPPYESVRLKGLLCQDPSFKAEEFYKKCGLVIKENIGIFPDHLGMELSFMSYLSDKEASALEKDDAVIAGKWTDYEKGFFESHIGLWAFDFLSDMERVALHPFYQGLAKLTLEFLKGEKEYLNAFSEKLGLKISPGIS